MFYEKKHTGNCDYIDKYLTLKTSTKTNLLRIK